ncbi:hypothetical protein ACS3SW_03200 [Roseobacteraceae bacterium S113]
MSDVMQQPVEERFRSRERVRALRRARRYLKDGDGALARVLTAYKAQVKRDPRKDYLPEK